MNLRLVIIKELDVKFHTTRWIGLALAIAATASFLVSPAFGAETVELAFKSLPQARYHFDGLIGQRVKASVENWLLPVPAANPGMIQMFRHRDREPAPNLVPWAGEFVGKYLISAIQASRMTNHPDLREVISQLVKDLIATQTEDGYLGPFPREIRLKSNCDLWGHYHCLMALLMWNEATGDPASLKACRRAADLICATFLDGKLRVTDAGSPEMNMAIIHGFGWLYRLTKDPRYLQMMQQIETDWEQAGDYLRTGLASVEFYQTPRPRWESLHDLQGLVELHLITGDTRYRTAFTHHWQSISRWDRRNTGGFSSDGKATGNPYSPTQIETCSTIAWLALSIDMLRLTGDSRVADELELSTFNAVAGAQHPSGRWWACSAPMDGVREPSASGMAFQARPGTPELNCCSVNGPRGLGSLSEWAVMKTADGLALNYYGPGMFQGRLPDNTPIALQIETDYPLAKKVSLRVEPLAARQFNLRLRIPAWSESTTVRVNNSIITNVIPGRYLELNRRWREGDRVTMEMDLRLRPVSGDREALGRVSIYRGPLLLVFDQRHNIFDEKGLPPLNLRQLDEAKETFIPQTSNRNSLQPWILVELPTNDGRRVNLCDFASAGASGTRYVSWLPVNDPPPAAPLTRRIDSR